MGMTIFLYRWKIKPGKEQCGSYGSRLHLTKSEEDVGYAQWPDVATREKCELTSDSSQARVLMREAVEHSYPDEQFEVRVNLLSSPELVTANGPLLDIKKLSV